MLLSHRRLLLLSQPSFFMWNPSYYVLLVLCNSVQYISHVISQLLGYFLNDKLSLCRQKMGLPQNGCIPIILCLPGMLKWKEGNFAPTAEYEQIHTIQTQQQQCRYQYVSHGV